MKHWRLALFALCLAGCAREEGPVARYEGLGLGRAPQAPRAVESSDLLVHIPEWTGSVKSALQSTSPNVLRQTIVFEGGTHGDHMIEAAVETREGADRGPPALRNPTQADVEDELRTKFPGVAMHIIEKPMSDVAGPYNLAVGRATDGSRCLYAWRWTDDLRVTADPSGIASVAAMFSHKSRPASLRVRLCSKYVTLDDLASLAQQIRFVPTFEMDRILGEPLAEKSAPRIDAAALAPTLENAFGSPSVAEPAPPPVQHSAAFQPAGGRFAHRQHVPRSALARQVLAAPADSGPRYLAPLPVRDRQSGYGAWSPPTSSAAGGLNGAGQDLNLPAAAYRGPPATSAGNGQAFGGL